jgi:two-component system sensor histidine kinase KdpD
MVALALAALVASTVTIALLRAGINVTYPAPVYLLAVLAVGTRYGTIPAILTSFAAFLLYDFLFVQPLYTLTINSPDEWLNLLLLLAVAVVIGRLAALQTERAREAADRAREAEALHSITGVLAATRTVDEAAPVVVSRLEMLTAMDRVWVGLGATPAEERTLADTAASEPVPVPGWQVVLQRRPDGQMRWVRAHVATGSARRAPRAALHRVRIEVAGETLGSLWALRARNELEPDRAETRILSAAADQLGQAFVRDRLTQEATSAEIARQSEALKTALLDSVSHDLRTPLATIRAAAGSMLDESVKWSEEDHREAFQAIDFEAERMGRLVRNLLDLSRIEGGALKPELEPCDVDDLVRQAIKRTRAMPDKHIVVDLPAGISPVLADELYLGQVLANLLENAIRYGGDEIRIGGSQLPDGLVEIAVEDDGRGVADAALPHLFEKFYQAGAPGEAQRRGMGIGLTVVEGLTRAMNGDVEACRSELGGLRVDIRLHAANVPADVDATAEAVDGAAASTPAPASTPAGRATSARSVPPAGKTP